MDTLAGKCILVGGGATGIGAATVRRLCAAGARVVVGDLNLEVAAQLARELAGAGGDVVALHFDQADEASVQSLVGEALARLGRIDGVFANVADLGIIMEDADLLGNDLAVWERTLRVNLLGTVALLRAVLPGMLDQGGGAMVLTSSDAAAIGEPERPAYAASKAAINSLARHVASKWGRQSIRCNVVSPGFVLTEQIAANLPQEMQDWMLKGARSPRHGAAEDIAAAVVFLLSDDGEWVNGQVWRVNGGVSYAL